MPRVISTEERMKYKVPIFLCLFIGCILILFYQTVKLRSKGPSHDKQLRIPRRPSNHSVMISSMEVTRSDIPDWISCPPAVTIDLMVKLVLLWLSFIVKETFQSIWSMAVNEKEALYNSVSALAIKVNLRR